MSQGLTTMHGDFGPPACVWSDILHMCNAKSNECVNKTNPQVLITEMKSDNMPTLSSIRLGTLSRDQRSHKVLDAALTSKICPLSIIQWAWCRRFLTQSMLWNTLHMAVTHTDPRSEAVNHDRLAVCQWLGQVTDLKNEDLAQTLDMLYRAISRGYTAIVYWLIDVLKLNKRTGTNNSSLNHSLLKCCVKSRNVELCRWMHSKFEFTTDDVRRSLVLLLVARNVGSLNVCRWLITTFTSSESPLTLNDVESSIIIAASAGHVSVCECLIDRFVLVPSDTAQNTDFTAFGLKLLENATMPNNHLPMCRWLANYFKLTAETLRFNNYHVLREVSIYGWPKTCQWFVEHFKLTNTDIETVGHNFVTFSNW